MLKELLFKCLPPGVLVRLRKIYHKIIILIYYLFRIFPINNKKIIISNYYGKGYGDNGKYITEEILRRKLDYDIVWIVNINCNKSFPKQVRTVRYGSLKAIYEEVTAKIWIDNCRKFSFVRKRKGQFYIQTWHGGIALKQIEKDVQNKLSNIYVENAKHDSKIADLFISNSKFCTELYRSAFWYDGEILECGYPRNDILINCPNDIKIKVFRYFHLNDDAKIVLYAPTFRFNYNIEVYDLNYNQILTVLEEKHGFNWVFLVRLHPNIAQKSDNLTFNEKVINATYYDDMQELMVASDILITDYSSIMFEFSLTGRPVVLYASDIEEYRNDRNFYFNLHDLPFPIANNHESLIKIILEFNESEYNKKLESFMQSVGVLEKGIASKTIVDHIMSVVEKNI